MRFLEKDYDDSLVSGQKVFISDPEYKEFGDKFEFIKYHALTDCYCFIRRASGFEMQVRTEIISPCALA